MKILVAILFISSMAFAQSAYELKSMKSCQVYFTHGTLGQLKIKKAIPSKCASIPEKNGIGDSSITFDKMKPTRCLCIQTGKGGLPVIIAGNKVRCKLSGDVEFEIMCYGE